MKGNTAIGCSNFKGCGFKIPFLLFGKKLTEKQIQDIIIKGKSTKMKGFAEHPENVSEGILRLTEDFSLEIKAE